MGVLVSTLSSQIVQSAKETIEEASKILGSSMSLLKEKLPMYVSRKRRALEKQKRVEEGITINST